MEQIHSWLQQHADQILEDVKLLVQAESPSVDKNAVDACGEILQQLFAKHLGLKAEIEHREQIGNLLTFKLGDGDKVTTILGHFDTVWSLGALTLREENGKLYGPGVLDMKAGLVQAIWAVRVLKEMGLLGGHTIQFLCNADEEMGSVHSRAWIEQQTRHSNQVLVVEPAVAGSNGLKIARKGSGRFTLHISGKEAHAGNNPEEGASAIQEMAYQILALHALNAPEKGTTINVGTASGGSRINVVAGQAELGIDLRITSLKEAERIEKAINELQPKLSGTKLRISGGLTRPPMEQHPRNAYLFDLAQQAASSLGLTLTGEPAGGGSDGNFTAALGIPTLDGLGATGAGIHAPHEHINIKDLTLRSALLAKLIASL